VDKEGNQSASGDKGRNVPLWVRRRIVSDWLKDLQKQNNKRKAKSPEGRHKGSKIEANNEKKRKK
jgi:hypothetical protein